MGYQTNISFLNDYWHEIQKEPQAFVDAIGSAMHDGTDSLVTECFIQLHDNRTEWARRNYVTVHKTQHADVPQVTYTCRNSSFDVYDFRRGIELGALNNKYNPKAYCKIGKEMAKELRRQAKDLDKAIKEYETKLQTS